MTRLRVWFIVSVILVIWVVVCSSSFLVEVSLLVMRCCSDFIRLSGKVLV